MPHDKLDDRWEEVNRELDDLAQLRVVVGYGDPAAREGELLDELEYEAGIAYFHERDSNRN